MIGLIVTLVSLIAPQVALAHRSGCHTLHTCPSDSDTYVCGDLGYPCNGVSSISDIDISEINVPLLIEVAFENEFGRRPTDLESVYWKNRFRSDKGSIHKTRRVMAWHHANGSFGPKVAVVASSGVNISRINALFRAAYEGRNPTVSENAYWISRIGDKGTEEAMVGAMKYHRLNSIQH